MKRKPFHHMNCSVAKALDVVGDPWTLLIVRDALLGVTRFDEFSSRLGIPRATLAARLEQLCDEGVLERRRYLDRPPRDEYVPTPKGRALRPVIVTLMQWGDAWQREDAPPTTIVEEPTGRLIEPVLVDRTTGVPLSDLTVRTVGTVADGIRGRG